LGSFWEILATSSGLGEIGFVLRKGETRIRVGARRQQESEKRTHLRSPFAANFIADLQGWASFPCKRKPRRGA
jgi:hypothetical protein